MTNCRACGQTLADQSAWSALEKYQEEYFHMTAIRLSDYEDPSQAKVCDLCARKLQDFESFRQICLQVHWQLQQLKVEKLEDDDSFTVAVEYLPDQDEEDPILKVFNENETADKCASVKTDSGGESDESYESDSEECYSPAKEDDDSSEDIKSEANSPIPAKKPRAKWGSRKKKEPREKRIVLSCDRCPKKFFAQYRFDAHKRAHDGLVPFECGMCDKAFARVKTLRLHRRQKHSNNPLCLPCDFPGCQHKFYTRLGFNRHKRRAHDPNYVAPPVTPFICDVCGKDFTSKGGLKTHSYTHYPDEMPFVCEVCDKKFPTVNKMKDHVLRHKGIKRHICPHCGLQKITRHELKFHIRNMHSSEPRCFPCTLCEKQLSSSGGLNTHVRTVHHGSKPHVCPFCSFAFGRTDHLKRHIRISCGVDRVGQKAVE